MKLGFCKKWHLHFSIEGKNHCDNTGESFSFWEKTNYPKEDSKK